MGEAGGGNQPRFEVEGRDHGKRWTEGGEGKIGRIRRTCACFLVDIAYESDRGEQCDARLSGLRSGRRRWGERR